MPPQRLGGRLNFSVNNVSSYISVIDASKQDKPGFNEEETAGYTRWDAGIDYRIKVNRRIDVLSFLRLKNLTDENIRNSTSFLRDVSPEPGRALELGFRVNF